MFRTGTDGLSVPPQQPEKAAQVHVGDDRDAHFSGRRQHGGPKQTRKNFHPGGKNPGTGDFLIFRNEMDYNTYNRSWVLGLPLKAGFRVHRKKVTLNVNDRYFER